MKPCPECGEIPINRLKFMFKVDQRSVECSNCGVELSGDSIIHALWYFSILSGVVIGVGALLIDHFLKWNISTIAFLIIADLIFIQIPVELIVWQIASYGDSDET